MILSIVCFMNQSVKFFGSTTSIFQIRLAPLNPSPPLFSLTLIPPSAPSSAYPFISTLSYTVCFFFIFSFHLSKPLLLNLCFFSAFSSSFFVSTAFPLYSASFYFFRNFLLLLLLPLPSSSSPSFYLPSYCCPSFMVSVHGCSASINILSSADCSTGTILVFL